MTDKQKEFRVKAPKFNAPEVKQKTPTFLGLRAKPGDKFSALLGLIPFVVVILSYIYFSNARHAENPDDKILPLISQMVDSMKTLAFEQDVRTEKYILLSDTTASLFRYGSGMILATIIGLLIGLNLGCFPGLARLFFPIIKVISIVPPLALLPILFIVMGVDEEAKIFLIFLGICPTIIRSVYEDTIRIPIEQKIKASTLGASQLQVVYKIILPQIMPGLINCIRVVSGAAFLFMISAEAIAATEGLGYRIFLVRRYLDMATIIPYAMWITFLGFTNDYALKKLLEKSYSWSNLNK